MAAAPVPHVLGFGGGVVKEGASDTQRTDELKEADGFDIGPRGALIAARDVAPYVAINDLATAPDDWTKLLGLRGVAGNNFVKEIAVGEGLVTATARYLLASFLREGDSSPVGGATAVKEFTGVVPTDEGVLVTVAEFPGIYPITNPVADINVFLVNLGAREGFPAVDGPGLWVAYAVPSSSEIFLAPISSFDALGTGSRGEVSAGTNAKQLRFRGVAAYNTFAMGWGFDENGGTDKEGPARLMFSNLAKPLKWGNDNVASSGDRTFSDTDAIFIGDGGERIRAGLSWANRFWIGTDKQLHYLAGYGRNSFISDGANPVAKAENVLGPNCMIEGPDKLLYGVGDQGLWAFDGQTFERHHRRLRTFDGKSLDWWDLIWQSRTRPDTYPGKTNADLVWMVTDWDNEQVVVGIPWCNAGQGYGYGVDTVLIKFNCKTGGFTRQVFTGIQFTAADYVRRQQQYARTRLLGTATAGERAIQKYGELDASVGQLADPLPKMKAGPYVLFGPDGIGVYRKLYLTLAWEDASGASPLGAWVQQTTPTNTPLRGIAWSPELGVAVAIGDPADALYSSDLENWTTTPMAAGGLDWYAVVWCPELNGGDGRFVAVGLDASADTAAYSDDGETWTMGVSCGTNNAWIDIAYSPSLERVVAVEGGGAAPEVVMTTDDGINWTDRTAGLPAGHGPIYCVCWNEDDAEYLAMAYRIADGMWVAIRSVDGITWTAVADVVTAAGHTFAFGGLKWAPALGKYVAIDGQAGEAYVSDDNGLTWTAFPLPAAIAYTGLVWSEEEELFVVVAQTGAANRIATSEDGATWSAVVSPADEPWRRVAFSPDLNMFFACASGNNANLIMTSSVSSVVALGLQFRITPTVDDEAQAPFDLYVSPTAPGAPADGDVWVDTSGTDTNLGNATAGTLVAAESDYLVKQRYRGAWQYTGFGGQKGARLTIPLSIRRPKRGTRLEVRVEAIAADRRFQLEGLGFKPAPVTNAQ